MIHETLRAKLDILVSRFQELAIVLANFIINNNTQEYAALNKEYSELQPIIDTYNLYLQLQHNQKLALELLNDNQMKELAQEELTDIKSQLEALELKLQYLLIPTDPNDDKNIFLEIRAGTGGDEASLFVASLARMYMRFAERNNWQTEIISHSDSSLDGYKEIIIKIIGKNAYSKLKFESGAHRVQRIPKTETQGRIHTSACTVAVMPEIDKVEDVNINPSDLKIDTYRASGAGGQHVNKTDSAIRITHLPTGIIVECQEDRSQHRNKAQALSVLASKIKQATIDIKQKEISDTRKILVGSGDRSQRIRTYNFPQGRITDHRINLTLYKLNDVMDGDLFELSDALMMEYKASQLLV